MLGSDGPHSAVRWRKGAAGRMRPLCDGLRDAAPWLVNFFLIGVDVRCDANFEWIPRSSKECKRGGEGGGIPRGETRSWSVKIAHKFCPCAVLF